VHLVRTACPSKLSRTERAGWAASRWPCRRRYWWRSRAWARPRRERACGAPAWVVALAWSSFTAALRRCQAATPRFAPRSNYRLHFQSRRQSAAPSGSVLGRCHRLCAGTTSTSPTRSGLQPAGGGGGCVRSVSRSRRSLSTACCGFGVSCPVPHRRPLGEPHKNGVPQNSDRTPDSAGPGYLTPVDGGIDCLAV
jgi:hypothetical protein